MLAAALEPVPRSRLAALNDGSLAAYRMTLVLRAGGRDIGTVRLGTLRPSGFSLRDAIRARRVAARGSARLARALTPSKAAVLAARAMGEPTSRSSAASSRPPVYAG